MQLCPLASGSKGNAYIIRTKDTTLLIDAGINAKTLKARLSAISLQLEDLDAVIITHEHNDHIQALKVLGKGKLPVFSNKETAKGIYQALQVKPSFKIFSTNESFHFRDFLIHPFSVQHDTLDPVGLVIEAEEKKVGFCTDLGTPTSLVQKKLQGCNFLVMESNHDPDKVRNAKRPFVYKKRVLSNLGHLSNEQCAALLQSLVHEKLEGVFLSHLSEECNEKELALEVVAGMVPYLKDKLLIAHQEKVSELISLE